MKPILISYACLLVLALTSSCRDEDTLTGTASITFQTDPYTNMEDAKLSLWLYFNEEDSEPFKSWEGMNMYSRDITLDLGKLNYGNYYIHYQVITSNWSSPVRSQPFQVIAGEHASVIID